METTALCVHSEAGNVKLPITFGFYLLRHFAFLLDRSVYFHDSSLDGVHLQSEDSGVGLLVETSDETVSFGVFC